MKHIADQQLLAWLKGAESAAQDKALRYIHQTHGPGISAWIRKNKGQSADIEDILQEGLFILYQKCREPDFQLTGTMGSFLGGICRRRWLKRLVRNREVPVGEFYDSQQMKGEDDSHYLEENERDSLLIRLIGQLGSDCQSIILLTYYERLKTREIIQMMNISNEQVARNKRNKCMKRLRALVWEHPEIRDSLR
ncbi:MAG: sigma-70 family RNA polymerase sigma factor [Bacteroidetes bacterium]|nr:MAG: sigma-70 family RNA polymerase sigma factor [Bacteroidota bacterium]